MKLKKKQGIIDLHKFLNIYYGLSRHKQFLIISSWGIGKKSCNKYNLNTILDLEKFLLENFYKEKFLKNEILNNINFYKNLKNYKGFRHIYRLPLRGQNTRNNRQTARKIKLPTIDLVDTAFKIKNKIIKELK